MSMAKSREVEIKVADPLPDGVECIYSPRFGKATRALACRKGNALVFLTLFSDHDKACGKK